MFTLCSATVATLLNKDELQMDLRELPLDVQQKLSAISARRSMSEQDVLAQLIDAAHQEDEITVGEQFFRIMAESAPILFYVYDLLADRNVYANTGLVQILGLSPEELQVLASDAVPTLVHPDDLPALAASISRLRHAETDQLYEVDYRLRHRDGSYRWVHDRARVFRRTETGQPWQIIGAAFDITERRQAEDALASSQAMLDQAQRVAGIGHWEMNVEDGALKWSSGMHAVMGFDPRQGTPPLNVILERVHPDDRAIMPQTLDQLLQQVDSQQAGLVWRLLHPDGRLRYIEGRAERILDATGRVEKLIGTNLDITDRIEASMALQRLNDDLEARVRARTAELEVANAQLQQSRAFIEKVAAMVPSLIYVFDLLTQEVIYTNDARAVKLDAELMRQAMSLDLVQQANDYVTENDQARAMDYITRMLQAPDGDLISEEFKITDVSGGTRWVVTHNMVLSRDANGQARQILGVVEDVTESRLAREDLKRALAHERQINVLKSRIVLTTSHEFRTPLSIISTSAQLIETYYDQLTEARRRAHLKKIRAQVDHMTQLLEDILLVGRLEAGVVSIKAERFDFCELLREVIDDFRAQTSQGVIHAQLPDAPLVVEADRKLWQQVVVNLISNAVKYSLEHTTVQVRLTLKDDNHLHLQVQDAGIGIPQDDQPYLFQAFHRASNVGSISGSGLGLAITRQAVELHRGSISIQSSEGEGTIVQVVAPLAPERSS